MLDIQDYYGKLARKEPISDDEIVDLLKELAHFRGSAAYLASCQAATLEILPKSSSKSARGRHVSLCDEAVKLLIGDSSPSPISNARDPEAARQRCISAAELYK